MIDSVAADRRHAHRRHLLRRCRRRRTERRELADALHRTRRLALVAGLEARTIYQGWEPESGTCTTAGRAQRGDCAGTPRWACRHPASADGDAGWVSTYQWENLYGEDFLYAGPLFVHHYSQAWIDLRGIRDPFMREKNSDYFENSRRAVHVQRRYAELNPREFVGY
ncbi:Glycoamylase-like domain-containing protein OS=Rhodanobacter lindaniclasticus OX=75310 GN=B1991_00420 PE=4 SV=1 [Rhodanobacter lindaniclasticus]